MLHNTYYCISPVTRPLEIAAAVGEESIRGDCICDYNCLILVSLKNEARGTQERGVKQTFLAYSWTSLLSLAR